MFASVMTGALLKHTRKSFVSSPLLVAATACLASLLLCSNLFAQGPDTRAQEGANLEEWLQKSEQALATVDNYTALFHRIEFVDGKLIPEEVMALKFKRPFKIYLRWLRPSTGQESLYVEGANNNKIKAHTTGMAGLINVNLDPRGTHAMRNSRHPITEAGLHNLFEKIAANARRGLRAGELTARDHGEETVYGRKTRVLEGILPKDSSKGYYCYRCILNLDLETKMPLKTQIFDWQDRLVECYGYETLQLNPGLSDTDFSPKNPQYHF
jgi:outer membrane lipoprotein-sorting protein